MAVEVIELSLTGEDTNLSYTVLKDSFILKGYYVDRALGSPLTTISIKHTNGREYILWSHTNATTTESKGIIPEIVCLRLQVGDIITLNKSTYTSSYAFLQLHVDDNLW